MLPVSTVAFKLETVLTQTEAGLAETAVGTAGRAETYIGIVTELVHVPTVFE
jgi:hypothetical protein